MMKDFHNFCQEVFSDMVVIIENLKGVCDGAVSEDGRGFNKYDVRFMNQIYFNPVWDESFETIQNIYSRLIKYKGQFPELFERLEKKYNKLLKLSKSAPKPQKAVFADFDGKVISIRIPKDKTLIDMLKSYAKPRFDWDTKQWKIDTNFIDSVRGFEKFVHAVKTNGIVAVDSTVEDILQKTRSIRPHRRITIDGQSVIFSFTYDPNLKDAIKETFKARFEPKTKKWIATLEKVMDVPKDKIDEVVGDFDGVDHLHRVIDEKIAEAKKAIEESKMVEIDVDLNIPGFTGTLRPFQNAGVYFASKRDAVLIADEMGLGKTIQAICTVALKKAYPCIVVCPASLTINWEREFKRWIPGVSISVINGKNNDYSADVIIISYDLLNRRMDDLKNVDFKAIVLDESHYIKNKKALRSKACLELSEKIPVKICLTGTPIVNRPIELTTQLEFLGKLNEFGGFFNFAKRYCDAYKTRFGWDFSGASNLDELQERLRATVMIRREKADVLTELPEKQRTVIPIRVSLGEYNKAVANFKKWLVDEYTKRGEEDRAYDSLQAEALVRIEKLKQLAVKAKMESVCNWISDTLESVQKLVVFVDHREVGRELIKRFADYNPVHIFGDDASVDRQAAVDTFQNDPDCRLIICSLKAAGVGLTLTAASHVLFVELGWNPATHDQAEDRCHRIGQKNTVNAWYLIAEGTIEENIYSLIESKRDVVVKSLIKAFLPKRRGRKASEK
jgi:SWI/SNF-related matrix-associated actin-dependent regulator 1 of chromatin subfamily A